MRSPVGSSMILTVVPSATPTEEVDVQIFLRDVDHLSTCGLLPDLSPVPCDLSPVPCALISKPAGTSRGSAGQ
jgi:hypothetical protein